MKQKLILTAISDYLWGKDIDNEIDGKSIHFGGIDMRDLLKIVDEYNEKVGSEAILICRTRLTNGHRTCDYAKGPFRFEREFDAVSNDCYGHYMHVVPFDKIDDEEAFLFEDDEIYNIVGPRFESIRKAMSEKSVLVYESAQDIALGTYEILERYPRKWTLDNRTYEYVLQANPIFDEDEIHDLDDLAAYLNAADTDCAQFVRDWCELFEEGRMAYTADVDGSYSDNEWVFDVSYNAMLEFLEDGKFHVRDCEDD